MIFVGLSFVSSSGLALVIIRKKERVVGPKMAMRVDGVC